MQRSALLLLVISVLGLTFFAITPDQPTVMEAVSSAPEFDGALVKVYTASAVNRQLSIRVLILRHANEQMAVGDANLVVRGVEKAAAAGLDIKLVGNHLCQSLDSMRQLLDTAMVQDAVPGDTLIIHTIGHGFAGGGLQALGSRSGVMQVMVDAAARHQQETLWWQLSCHAAAGLPEIESLPGDRREIFSNIASSSASQVSPAGVEGVIMEKLFMALAGDARTVDQDGDEIVTAGELRRFLNSLDGRYRRGHLLFAQSEDEPMFGTWRPWDLPIVDRLEPQREYDRNYILVPRRH